MLSTEPSEFGGRVDVMERAAAHSVPVRTTFSRFPAAVSALCAVVDGEPVGLVATSLTVGVSYDPPMIAFAIRNGSATWPVLMRSARIGVSLLAEHQSAVCRLLASAGDRFAGVATTHLPGGALLIDEATTWMECSVTASLLAGDHTLVTLTVHHVGHNGTAQPLVFHDGCFPRLCHN